MKKLLLSVTLSLLCFLGTLHATTITATATGGDWNTSSTWVGGVVPGAGDEAIIPTGSTVTWDDLPQTTDPTTGNALFVNPSSIIVNGIFNFAAYSFTGADPEFEYPCNLYIVGTFNDLSPFSEYWLQSVSNVYAYAGSTYYSYAYPGTNFINGTGSSDVQAPNDATPFYVTVGVTAPTYVQSSPPVPVPPSATPTVTTSSATATSSSVFLLQGLVNDNSSAASNIYFNYGTTTGFGQTIIATPSSLSASTTTSGVSADLSGLNPSTVYYYQAAATNANGTSTGATKSFTSAAVVEKIWTPGAGIYTPNKVLTFTIWWTNTNQGPLVANTSGGTPYLPITIGSTTEKAYLDSVSVLNLNAYFSYSVTASDIAQGITIGPSIILNGGTLKDQYGTPVALDVSAPVDPMPTNGSGTPILSLIDVGPYPIVYTQPATSIGETTATLNGNVNDDGYNTGTAFQYSTSRSGPYSLYTGSPATVNAGTGATGISGPLSGLDSGTVYYFLAQGSNSIGTVTGDTLSFATATYTQSVWVNAPGTYQTGTALNFTVNYKQTYATGLVVTGTPYITMNLASGAVHVPLVSATGNQLLFSYTVAGGDNAPTGIGLGSSINLNGGTITDSAGTPVSLYLNNVSDTADILIDGTAPQLVSILRENPSIQTITDAISPVTFQVTFNKGVENVSASNFTIQATGNAAGTIAGVTPSTNGASYDVTVGNLSGAGNLNIALTNPTGITDSLGIALAASTVTPQFYTLSTVPALTGANGQITWYAEGSASQPIVIASNIVASDVGGNITTATISFGSGFTSGDVLSFTNTANITGSYNASTGVLTLTGTGTPSDWTAALESITFNNTGTNISVVAANNRKIYFNMEDDAGNNSGTVQQEINVKAGFTMSNSTFTLSACQNGAAVDFSGQLGVLDYSTTDQLTYTSLVAPTQGTLSGLPATISANGSTVSPSNIFYTPTAGATGTDQFTLNVSNGTETVPVNFTVTINAAPSAGNITAPASLCQSATSQLTASVSGGVWSTTTSSLVSVSGTGVLTGLAGGSGANITYTVTDGNGCSATADATVDITTTPVITLTPSTAQSVNQEGSAAFSVTYDASTTNLEWTYSGMGVSINGGGSSTGWVSTASGSAATLNFSGTATSGTLTVGAENGCGTSTQSVTINVNPISLTINTTGSTNGIVGTAMSYSFGTSGGNGTYNYTSSSTLPAGLTFNNGVVSGTPSQAGSFPESVTSTDGKGAAQTLNYTLTVGAPILNMSPAANSTLPAGSYATPYVGAQITVSGGTAPYTFSASGLPAGMGIDPATGMISGTPTATGSFTVQVTATDHSTGTGSPFNITQTYTLNVAQSTLTITVNNATMVYGGTFPTFTLSYSGWQNGDGPSSLTTAPVITTSASPFSGVGNYALIPSGAVDPNYTIVYVNGNLSITPATLTVTASDESMVYGSSSLPALAVTYSGWANGDGPASLTTAASATTTATAASSVGTYPITPSGAVDPNYTITYVPGTLTITPATLTVTASDESMVYGNATLPALAVTYAGWVNGDGPASLTTAASATTTATVASPVGTYPITPSGAVDPNYTISYVPGTLTITPAILTITASNESMVYGSSSTLPALAITYSGWVNGDGPASLTTVATATTSATATSPVGTYPITPSGAADPNYTITYVNGTLSITQAVLTITAGNASMTYGGTVPNLTYTYSGWLNGDGPSSLTTAPTVSTTATSGSNVGTYPITVSGAVSANYTLTYVSGTLTINPATLLVTATSLSRYYNTPNPTLTFTYSGFVLGQTASVITDAPSISTTAVQSSLPGQYPITLSGGTAPNYVFQYQDGVLTVIQSLNNVITFDALAPKTYGDPDFAIAAIASSGLAVRFVSADPSIATVYQDNGTWMVHIVSAGTVNIEAFQDGDGQYGAAAEVDQPLLINKANQTIAFQAPPSGLTTGQVITLNATASSGLPVTYTISDPSMATLNGNQLVITGTGSFTITANQAGNEDYNPAAPVSYTINTFNSAGFTGGIGLFPNPAHGTTHLRFSIDYLITKYAIYSIDGRCVQNQSMVTNNSNDIEVNVAGLAPGYYLVHVACVENHVVKDLVFKLLVY
jgi:hypothetical protein